MYGPKTEEITRREMNNEDHHNFYPQINENMSGECRNMGDSYKILVG
jgi:hypothetical protein